MNSKYAFDDIQKGKNQDLLNGQKKVQENTAPLKKESPPAAATKKKQGRPADPEGTKVSLSLKTMDRMEDGPTVIVNGTGRRIDTKFVNLPIPTEVYDRIKTGGNISASLVALMMFGLESLDKENQALWASYTKEIGSIE